MKSDKLKTTKLSYSHQTRSPTSAEHFALSTMQILIYFTTNLDLLWNFNVEHLYVII